MPVPCLRTDSPNILREVTPEEDELALDLSVLDAEIERIAKNAAADLCALSATDHSLDRERIRELVVELLRDETHDARTAIENRLSEIAR